jgi:hypothetical protein
MTMQRRKAVLGWGVALALLSTLVLAGAVQAAHAAPAEPTLTWREVQTLVDNGGGQADAYFKTVVKGSDIITIPATVLGVTTNVNGAYWGEADHLILFEAAGPVIAHIGVIAQGMSGSPLYVNDGGTYKLAGAVSYGVSFPLNGQGLATPIEYMSAIENEPGFRSPARRLPAPAAAAGGMTRELRLMSGAATPGRAGANSILARPLAEVSMGGIPAGSRLFKAFQKHYAAHGMTLSAAGLSGAGDPSFETTLEGGAAVTALACRGDLVAGAAGTITYENAGAVIAFGHPLYWAGQTGLFLTNGWVDGILGSSAVSSKMVAPTKVRGIITQDRSAGIAGNTDALPEETPVTSQFSYAPRSVTVTSTSWLTRLAADGNDWNYMGLADAAVSVAEYKAINAWAVPGSAVTTTTIVVTDGTDTYRIVRPNIWDDPYDIGWVSTVDVSTMMYSLQSLNAPDLTRAHIVSVGTTTSAVAQRHPATVVGVSLQAPLKIGDNVVHTLLKVRGVPTTQTVDSVLTLPPGIGLHGSIRVTGGSWANSYDPWMMFDNNGQSGGEASLAQAVADLEATPKNNDILLHYWASGGDVSGYPVFAPGRTRAKSKPHIPTTADTSASTSWYSSGEVQRRTATVYAWPSSTVVGAGGRITIRGLVYPVADDTTLSVVGVSPGDVTERVLLAQVPATTTGGPAMFVCRTPAFTRNTTVSVQFHGDTASLASAGTFAVKVRPRVRLTASPRVVVAGKRTRLVASVSYGTAGRVVFDAVSRGRWRKVGIASVHSGRASVYYRPRAGSTMLRARFLGTPLLIAAKSATIVVRTR